MPDTTTSRNFQDLLFTHRDEVNLEQTNKYTTIIINKNELKHNLIYKIITINRATSK